MTSAETVTQRKRQLRPLFWLLIVVGITGLSFGFYKLGKAHPRPEKHVVVALPATSPTQ